MTTIHFVRTADGWGLGADPLAAPRRSFALPRALKALRSWNKTGSIDWLRPLFADAAAASGGAPRELPTVADFVVPRSVRIAQQVAQATIVRDAAAFGALVLFATMVAVLLGFAEPGA